MRERERMMNGGAYGKVRAEGCLLGECRTMFVPFLTEGRKGKGTRTLGMGKEEQKYVHVRCEERRVVVYTDVQYRRHCVRRNSVYIPTNVLWASRVRVL